MRPDDSFETTALLTAVVFAKAVAAALVEIRNARVDMEVVAMRVSLRGVALVLFLGLAASPAFAEDDIWVSRPVMFRLGDEIADAEDPIVSAEETASTFSDTAAGDTPLSDYYQYEPRLSVYVGAMYMCRANPDPAVFVIPIFTPGVISNASDFAFDGDDGLDLGARFRVNDYTSVEVRYFGELSFVTDQVSYGAVGDVRGGGYGIYEVVDLFGNYESSLLSYEANLLRRVTDRITFVAGFRSLEIDELLRMNFIFPGGTVDFSYSETNRLYGGQLGAYFKLWDLGGPLQVNAGMKAGVYGNSASHRFNMYHSDGLSIPSATDGQTTSFAGEIQVTASYQLTSFAAVRFGYQMLWVDRLALSSDELARATFLMTQDGIGLNGDVFYHGATGGIEFSW